MKRMVQHMVPWLLATLLLLVVGNAYAQDPPLNTGDDPYMGTTHRYRVTAQLLTNIRTWEISNGTDIYTPISLSAKFVLSNAGNVIDALITFTAPEFSPGHWVLRYSEESTGSNSCVAVREFDIYLRDNTFYESLYPLNETPPGDFAECHDSTGTLQNWTTIQNTNYNTRVNFPVYMYKDEDFDLNQWEFDATINLSGTDYVLVAVNKGATNSTAGGNYTVTRVGTTNVWEVVVNGVNNVTTDNIELEVVVSGEMYIDCIVTLDISNGLARSGTGNYVVTNDNFAIYPDPDNDPLTQPPAEWRSKQITIYGLPDTPNITVLN